MRIRLQVSGGVTGVRRPPVEVDTREAGDGEALERLAGAVARQSAPAAPPGPDRFQYDLELDGAPVRLHETALSPEAAELIDRLRRRPPPA
jgi:hypothetical protein